MTSHTRMRPLMGTYVEITATGTQPLSAIEAAFDEIASIEAKLSYYNPSSDISRINSQAPNTVLKIDSQTWHVLSICNELSYVSEGIFDISVAPKLIQMGYLPPSVHQSATGNWKDILLLEEGHLQLTRPVCIDLGGIAKGYCVDRAINVLRTYGLHSGAVNAGGDLRIFGPDPQPLYTKHPSFPEQTLPITEIYNGAAATSAAYYSRKIVDETSITPLINTKTGLPLPCDYSVTVLAETCMMADALTKIVHSDPHSAKSILESYNARAFLIKHNLDDDTLHIFDSHSAN